MQMQIDPIYRSFRRLGIGWVLRVDPIGGAMVRLSLTGCCRGRSFTAGA